MNDAAVAVVNGIDGMRIFKSSDPVEIMTLQVLAERAENFNRTVWKSRAALIANAVGRLFKR